MKSIYKILSKVLKNKTQRVCCRNQRNKTAIETSQFIKKTTNWVENFFNILYNVCIRKK